MRRPVNSASATRCSSPSRKAMSSVPPVSVATVTTAVVIVATAVVAVAATVVAVVADVMTVAAAVVVNLQNQIACASL